MATLTLIDHAFTCLSVYREQHAGAWVGVGENETDPGALFCGGESVVVSCRPLFGTNHVYGCSLCMIYGNRVSRRSLLPLHVSYVEARV